MSRHFTNLDKTTRAVRASQHIRSGCSQSKCFDAKGPLLMGCLVLVLCQPSWAQGPTDDALQQALGSILAVQPEGGGSVAAAQAWKVVGQANYKQLPLVLRAMDKADGLAANWLSMALDRIVELQGSEQLPVDVLTRAVLSTEHSLLTRKISLDLLARIDARRVEQLESDLRNDPEAELRRPALEKAIADLRDAADDMAALKQIHAWLEILSTARDQDQVMQIARALKTLGHEVDLAAQFGYLVDWQLVGPFDNSDGKGYDAVHPPETLTLEGFAQVVSGNADSLPGKSGAVSWKSAQAKPSNGDVSLNDEIAKLRDVLGYGATVFVSERDQQVDVRLRIQNSFKVWLNGKLLIAQPVGHTGNSFDQYVVRADLQAGKNLLVVKSCQVNLQGATEFYDNWHFCVRVCDATGGAILSTDRMRENGAGSTEKGADK